MQKFSSYLTENTKTNRLMFRETIAAYCENHTKHTKSLFGKNPEF
jgi:hypothetical protein